MFQGVGRLLDVRCRSYCTPGNKSIGPPNELSLLCLRDMKAIWTPSCSIPSACRPRSLFASSFPRTGQCDVRIEPLAMEAPLPLVFLGVEKIYIKFSSVNCQPVVVITNATASRRVAEVVFLADLKFGSRPLVDSHV